MFIYVIGSYTYEFWSIFTLTIFLPHSLLWSISNSNFWQRKFYIFNAQSDRLKEIKSLIYFWNITNIEDKIKLNSPWKNKFRHFFFIIDFNLKI